MQLDTGSEQGLTLYDPDALKGIAEPAGDKIAVMDGGGNISYVKPYSNVLIKVGNNNMYANVNVHNSSSTVSLEGEDGLLGLSFFKGKSFIIDLSSKIFTVLP